MVGEEQVLRYDKGSETGGALVRDLPPGDEIEIGFVIYCDITIDIDCICKLVNQLEAHWKCQY